MVMVVDKPAVIIAEGNADHGMIVLNNEPAGCSVWGIHAAPQSENEKAGQ